MPERLLSAATRDHREPGIFRKTPEEIENRGVVVNDEERWRAGLVRHGSTGAIEGHHCRRYRSGPDAHYPVLHTLDRVVLTRAIQPDHSFSP
jgi:hypothetical protein